MNTGLATGLRTALPGRVLRRSPVVAERRVQGPVQPLVPLVAPGMMMPYAGTVAIPKGWLLCDGSAVGRQQYQDLFAAIGITYGAGDGYRTFNLPNLMGRCIVGVDTGQAEFSALATTGGSKISTAPHTHDLGAHTHSGTSAGPSTNSSGYVINPQGWQNANTGHLHNHDHFHSASIGNVGWAGNGQHNGHYNHGGYAAEGPEPGNYPGGSIPVNVATAGGMTADQDRQHQHGLENHNHDLQSHSHTMSTGGPSPTVSGASSAAATSGNLQPFITLNYLIKT